MKLSLTKDLAPAKARVEEALRALVAPDAMDGVYGLKAAIARDYVEAGAVHPLLSDEAAARGVPEAELARQILERHGAAQQALVARERARQALLARARAATTEQELEAVQAELDDLLKARS